MHAVYTVMCPTFFEAVPIFNLNSCLFSVQYTRPKRLIFLSRGGWLYVVPITTDQWEHCIQKFLLFLLYPLNPPPHTHTHARTHTHTHTHSSSVWAKPCRSYLYRSRTLWDLSIWLVINTLIKGAPLIKGVKSWLGGLSLYLLLCIAHGSKYSRRSSSHAWIFLSIIVLGWCELYVDNTAIPQLSKQSVYLHTTGSLFRLAHCAAHLKTPWVSRLGSN